MSVLWDVRDSTVVNYMEMNYKYCMQAENNGSVVAGQDDWRNQF